MIVMDISSATRHLHIGLIRSSICAPRPLQRFSTSSIHAATRVARPPITRSMEKQMQSVPSPVKAPDYSKPPVSDTGDLWPTAIVLKDANRLGLLTITVEKAVEVMRDFEKKLPISPEQIFKSCLIPRPIPPSLTMRSPRTRSHAQRRYTARPHPSPHKPHNDSTRPASSCCQAQR